MKKYFSIITLLISLVSCRHDSDDVANPQNPNDNELVTTVKMIFTDVTDNNKVITAIYKPQATPIISETIQLEVGKTYNTQLLLLDESKIPVDTISNEVEEEGNEHQVFYTFSSGANVTFTYEDDDDNGVPIGLLTQFTAGAKTENNQTLKIILKHQGDQKPKSGNGNSEIGSTDVEAIYPLVVK